MNISFFFAKCRFVKVDNKKDKMNTKGVMLIFIIKRAELIKILKKINESKKSAIKNISAQLSFID